MRKITLMVLILYSSIAGAQAPTKNLMVRGVGLHTCGEAMQNIDKYGEQWEILYSYWIAGFISGRNAERTSSSKNFGVSDGISEPTIMAMFKSRCRQDALTSVLNTAAHIYNEIETRQR